MQPPNMHTHARAAPQVRALEAALAATEGAFRGLRHAADIEVSTVDGYQGREADAVVFSFTRNNDKQALGFVRDPRRLNVAITRPRRALVVLGAPNMLRHDDNWGRCDSLCRAGTGVPPAVAMLFALPFLPGVYTRIHQSTPLATPLWAELLCWPMQCSLEAPLLPTRACECSTTARPSEVIRTDLLQQF